MATLIIYPSDIKKEIKNSKGEIVDVIGKSAIDSVCRLHKNVFTSKKVIDTILYIKGNTTCVLAPKNEVV